MTGNVRPDEALLVGFTERLRSQIVDSDRAEQAKWLSTYLSGGPDAPYSGRAFETYGTNLPLAITGDDLVAVTMLSIEISRHTTSGFTPEDAITLEARASDLSAELEWLPTDRSLETLKPQEFERFLGPDSPGDRLYELLREVLGNRRVARSKLLARKRPALFPVHDASIVERLESLRDGEPNAGHLSLLRVADITLWRPR